LWLHVEVEAGGSAQGVFGIYVHVRQMRVEQVIGHAQGHSFTGESGCFSG
jgi:hypothetical protein